MDELEFTNYISTIIEAAGPAFNTASENAARNKAPYCRIFTTTPGNIDSEPVSSTEAMRAQMHRFSESLYDKDIDTAKEIIKRNSKINVVYIEFSYVQLGKDENWFVKLCGILNNNKVKIKREIFLKRIRGSSQSPFEQDDLEMINNLVEDPIEEIYLLRIYSLMIYKKLNKNIPYIVGIDCSAGVLNDNTAMTIVDPYTEEPVAEFKSPIIGSSTIMVKFLVTLVRTYIPRAILGIERNHAGDSLIEQLKYSPIGQNLYFDSNKLFLPDPDVRLDEKGFAIQEAKNKRSFGVYTQTKSRDIMISILFNRVREHKSKIKTRYITDDINNLVRTPTGKIMAVNGRHDDSVMSYLIALYILFNGTNLQRYGFSRGDSIPYEEKEKTMQDYLDEMPEHIASQFQSVKTAEDYFAEARAEMEQIQKANRVRRVGETVVEDISMAEDEYGGDEYDSTGTIGWDFINGLNDD